MDNVFNKLKKDEQITFDLRGVFEQFGYRRFKASKFEEYGLYLDNKNFLKCADCITFNAPDGKLLALKPDITLSIAKNVNVESGQVEKLYYCENVYRLQKQSKEYKEIGQLGLEAMGAVDAYTVFEVVNLALESLQAIDDDFILDVSHIGFLTGLLSGLEVPSAVAEKLLGFIVSKNLHDLKRASAEAGLSESAIGALERVVTLKGDFASALAVANEIAVGEQMKQAIDELSALYEAVKCTPYADKMRLDFSIVNDTAYYNGVIFQGYVKRVPSLVLSGGRYDLLMARFQKSGGAIGFALNLDELSRYYPNSDNSVDVLLLYDEGEDEKELFCAIKKLNAEGKTVRAEKAISDKIKFKSVMRLERGGASLVNGSASLERGGESLVNGSASSEKGGASLVNGSASLEKGGENLVKEGK